MKKDMISLIIDLLPVGFAMALVGFIMYAVWKISLQFTINVIETIPK